MNTQNNTNSSDSSSDNTNTIENTTGFFAKAWDVVQALVMETPARAKAAAIESKEDVEDAVFRVAKTTKNVGSCVADITFGNAKSWYDGDYSFSDFCLAQMLDTLGLGLSIFRLPFDIADVAFKAARGLAYTALHTMGIPDTTSMGLANIITCTGVILGVPAAIIAAAPLFTTTTLMSGAVLIGWKATAYSVLSGSGAFYVFLSRLNRVFSVITVAINIAIQIGSFFVSEETLAGAIAIFNGFVNSIANPSGFAPEAEEAAPTC